MTKESPASDKAVRDVSNQCRGLLKTNADLWKSPPDRPQQTSDLYPDSTFGAGAYLEAMAKRLDGWSVSDNPWIVRWNAEHRRCRPGREARCRRCRGATRLSTRRRTRDVGISLAGARRRKRSRWCGIGTRENGCGDRRCNGFTCRRSRRRDGDREKSESRSVSSGTRRCGKTPLRVSQKTVLPLWLTQNDFRSSRVHLVLMNSWPHRRPFLSR